MMSEKIITNIKITKEFESVQTTSDDQTEITLKNIEVDEDVNNMPSLYIEGSFELDFSVTSPTTIDILSTYPKGTTVSVLQYNVGDGR